MNIEKAYEVMQAAWVKLYNVEEGDTVRVLRAFKDRELGYGGEAAARKNERTGKSCVVMRIDCNHIVLDWDYYPFFCLEVIKKAEPKIEITVKVNGEETSLRTLSEETLLNIRKNG